MAYRDPEVGRRRAASAFGAVWRNAGPPVFVRGCGDRPPAPGRSICRPCAEKCNRASRARDVRLRAAGQPRRDPERERECERGRARRETAKRTARGSCTRCGKHPAMPGRKSCEPCLEKRRAADRARYAAGKAAGLPYGGADPEVKRRAGRAKSRHRSRSASRRGSASAAASTLPPKGEPPASLAATRGKRRKSGNTPSGGPPVSAPRCGGPAFDGLTRCAPCNAIEQAGRNPDRKNRRSRRLYAQRRARGECTSCGAPAQGASRCAPCAEKSYHGSQHFKGIPVWDLAGARARACSSWRRRTGTSPLRPRRRPGTMRPPPTARPCRLAGPTTRTTSSRS